MFAENAAARPTCSAILDRSFLRSTAQVCRKGDMDAPSAAGGAYGGGGPPKPTRDPSPALPKVKTPASAAAGFPASNEAAPEFRKGDLMEYWSETHGEWLSAVVTAVDLNRRAVQIDLKPGTWVQLDGGRIRLKAKTPKGREPSPMMRSPAGGGGQPRTPVRNPSPARWEQRPYSPN